MTKSFEQKSRVVCGIDAKITKKRSDRHLPMIKRRKMTVTYELGGIRELDLFIVSWREARHPSK